MSINLLPQEYQNDLKGERFRRFISVLGIALFLIIVANIILLSPLWILLRVQEREHARQLTSTKQRPEFLRIADIETEIKELNSEISVFASKEKELFAVSPVIKSVLERRPAGIVISNISFSAADSDKPSSVSISGVAQNRELLLEFAKSNEENEFVKNVNSPISNLLKETEIDYSLVLDLND